MLITYGVSDNNINVTEVCLSQLLDHNTHLITIPAGDQNRADYFTDPLYGTLKRVFVQLNKDNTWTEYDHTVTLKINIETNKINARTNKTHAECVSQLTLQHGSFSEELPEQLMTVKYLTGNEKVLEIGGNIGRNTLVIASILATQNNTSNFVTMECDNDIAKQLIENRNANHFDFHIECCALSKRKLIQQGWNTIPSDTLLKNHKWVQTITWDELSQKYKHICFDTLVLDCEGAFYYILRDMPEILHNINLIIMENDYFDLSHKEFIDNVLRQNHFYRDYVESGGWGPCQNFFFEVWMKKKIKN
jgi:FkbM family methyltransferase